MLLKLNDPKSAVEKANYVLTKSPDNIEAYIVLATERMNAGDNQKALEIINKGLKAKERNIPMLLMKIKAHENLKDVANVEATYKSVIAYYPNEVSIRKSLIKFYLENGKGD